MTSVVARTLMAVGTLAALASAPAHAGNVSWSVGIQAPLGPGVSVGTVIGNGYPGYPVVAAPVYVPPPVVVPAPVYAPPVVVPPVAGVVYAAPVWVGGRWVRRPVHHRHPVAWYPRHYHGGYWGHHGAPVRTPGRHIRY